MTDFHPADEGFDYQRALISGICALPWGFGRVLYDGNVGSIFVEVGDVEVYATPGYEGDWSGLPVTIVDDSGRCDCYDAEATWTGNIDRDVATWARIVRDIVAQEAG